VTTLEFRIEPEVSRVRFLRADIRERLEGLDVAEGDIDRLVLVVDEIVSNSIEHGATHRSPADVLTMRLTVESAFVSVEFHDSSVPTSTIDELLALLAKCRSGIPPIDNERGRGLFLIDDGLSELSIGAGEHGVGMQLRGRLVRETA